MLENGFLGNDASLMLDFVVCALVLVVPLIVGSIYAVKVQKAYNLHRTLQLLIGITLLVTVLLFEIDLQLVHKGWINIVNKNPESPRLAGENLDFVRNLLRLHLVFAISTPVFWIATTVLALRKFSNPPYPGQHSGLHKTLGWLSTIDLVLTSVTGLIFYYAAFMS
ncbi:DUF420 domain-containing protein [Calycomorphotria hydatis]|uniref:DUF420 domain-containing protein n=1 Tax=Calycomorphotria hydatis TaxID=2528027 RepID=A0A517T6C3_9PLAN|nr:DUF420 domain-containing protein [Calycomorphotria hydatis]QDT63898.1 hypothetical protein V22_11250 [Calycomorphotria hydatis]